MIDTQAFFGVREKWVRPLEISWTINLGITSEVISPNISVPKMEESENRNISCMDTAYGYGKTHPQNCRK